MFSSLSPSSLISHRIISFRDLPFTCDVQLKALQAFIALKCFPVWIVDLRFITALTSNFFSLSIECHSRIWDEILMIFQARRQSSHVRVHAKLRASIRQLNKIPRSQGDNFRTQQSLGELFSRNNITIPCRAEGCLSLWLNQVLPHRKKGWNTLRSSLTLLALSIQSA